VTLTKTCIDCKKDCTSADPVWLAPDLCAECGRRQIDELRERVDAALRNIRAYREGVIQDPNNVLRRIEMADPCITCGREIGPPDPKVLAAKAKLGMPIRPAKRCPSCVWTSLLEFAASPDEAAGQAPRNESEKKK